MALLMELKQQRERAMAKADVILKACETAKRPLSDTEASDVDACMAEVNALTPQIKRIESMNTIRSTFGSTPILDKQKPSKKGQVVLSEEYDSDFWAYVASQGHKVGAALYEGSSAAGGFAVPITVDGVIVPLAPNEFAVRRLATVVPTANDVKLPIQATHSTAAFKAESGGANNAFGGSDLTLAQKTLTAYMLGEIVDITWEIAQDVPLMQAFATEDMILGVQVSEEDKYVNGSGTGEPEGILTSADTGVVDAGVELDAILDVIGSLKAQYLPNATFLMQRPVSITIRKAQLTANLFDPVWVTSGGKDFLYGYPVEYSSAMPLATQLSKPIVFGDFKRGLVIGDRGGSGINVKVLDQPKANLGIIQLLAYRRTDSRVRRTEALKTLVIDSGS